MAKKRFIEEFKKFFKEDYCKQIRLDNIYSDFNKTSLDDTNGINLINSKQECLDFDECKRLYIEKHKAMMIFLHPNQKINYLDKYKSNDALKTIDNIEYFIEFKNTNKTKFKELFSKIKDSLIIYLDIMDEKFSYARENLGYIYVYSYEKDNQNLPEYESLDRIQGHLKKQAKEPSDKFQLKKRLEGFYFKDVMAMNDREFEKFIEK